MLFAADVGTDIYNGEQRIRDGDPIWGSLMLSLIFLPATIVFAYFSIQNVLLAPIGYKTKLKEIVKNLILYVPSFVVVTILGIAYVIYAGCRKSIDPRWKEKKVSLSKIFQHCQTEKEESMLRSKQVQSIINGSKGMRMCETLFESNPQSILGEILLQKNIWR